MKEYERVTQKQGEPKIVSKRVYYRLRELEDDLESGKLVRLPCKVGDKVYCIYHFDDVEEDFEYDIIPEEVVDIIVQEDDFDIGTACRIIGKFKRVCVCFTKAEAEKRLKELNGYGKDDE